MSMPVEICLWRYACREQAAELRCERAAHTMGRKRQIRLDDRETMHGLPMALETKTHLAHSAFSYHTHPVVLQQ